MSELGLDTNEYGTPISTHVCADCGGSFTVCPPAPDNWGGCLGDHCESYDINRDVDALMFFGAEMRRDER